MPDQQKGLLGIAGEGLLEATRPSCPTAHLMTMPMDII